MYQRHARHHAGVVKHLGLCHQQRHQHHRLSHHAGSNSQRHGDGINSGSRRRHRTRRDSDRGSNKHDLRKRIGHRPGSHGIRCGQFGHHDRSRQRHGATGYGQWCQQQHDDSNSRSHRDECDSDRCCHQYKLHNGVG